MSSRNGYLNSDERRIAPTLQATLKQLVAQLQQGNRSFHTLEEQANRTLEAAGFKRDYIHICRRNDLARACEKDRQLVILAAAKLGPARLIDNIEVNL